MHVHNTGTAHDLMHICMHKDNDIEILRRIPLFILQSAGQGSPSQDLFTFTKKLWKGYVNHTFVIKDTDKLSGFHMALNNSLPGIQFTLDKEKDNNLPFRNILIHRLPTST